MVSPKGNLWGKLSADTWGEINLDGTLLRKVQFDRFASVADPPEVSSLGFYMSLFDGIEIVQNYFVSWDGDTTKLTPDQWEKPSSNLPTMSLLASYLQLPFQKNPDFIPDSYIWNEAVDYFDKIEGRHFRSMHQADKEALDRGEFWRLSGENQTTII